MITVQQWIDALEKGKPKFIYVARMGWKCSENVVGPYFVVEKALIKNCHFTALDESNGDVLFKSIWMEEAEHIHSADCFFSRKEAEECAKRYEEKHSWSSPKHKMTEEGNDYA